MVVIAAAPVLDAVLPPAARRAVPAADATPDSCDAAARPTVGRTRRDDGGAPDADPADPDGAADCEDVLADGVDDDPVVVPKDVPECSPSDGVLTGGVLTGAVVDGVVTGG